MNQKKHENEKKNLVIRKDKFQKFDETLIFSCKDTP